MKLFASTYTIGFSITTLIGIILNFGILDSFRSMDRFLVWISILFNCKFSHGLTFLFGCLFFAFDIVGVVHADIVIVVCANDNYDSKERSNDIFEYLVNGAIPVILIAAQTVGKHSIYVRIMDTLLLIITPYVMPVIILWCFDHDSRIIPLWVKIIRTISSLLSIPRIFTLHHDLKFADILASIAMTPMYTADIMIWIKTLPIAFDTLDLIVFISYFVFLGIAFIITCFVPIIILSSSEVDDNNLWNSIWTIYGIIILINLMINALSFSTLYLNYHYTKAIFALTIISVGRYFDDKSFIYKVLRKQHMHGSTDEQTNEQTLKTVEQTDNNFCPKWERRAITI